MALVGAAFRMPGLMALRGAYNGAIGGLLAGSHLTASLRGLGARGFVGGFFFGAAMVCLYPTLQRERVRAHRSRQG